MIDACLAHRAGGQALAAYLHGVRITDLELTGITLWFPFARRTELLSEPTAGPGSSRIRNGPDRR